MSHRKPRILGFRRGFVKRLGPVFKADTIACFNVNLLLILIFFAISSILNGMTDYLKWPVEPDSQPTASWHHAGSNLCLDFHGDPANADLVVYSDGNHHMALAEVVAAFQQHHPQLNGLFYATTPPSVLLNIVQQGQIQMGNLVLSHQPHVFISPEGILKKLVQFGKTPSYQAFMQSRGNVILIRKSNPKSIQGIKDLLRDDVTLFISNPKTETASYEVYKDTLLDIAQHLNIEQAVKDKLDPAKSSLVYGERIHHREVPQALFNGKADAAVVYYHLALRYSRIFPEEFSYVSLTGGEMEQETGNQQTTYFISTMNESGQYGQSFVDFCLSDEVTEIYQRHGLTRPTPS